MRHLTKLLVLALLIACFTLSAEPWAGAHPSQKPVRVVAQAHPPMGYKDTDLAQLFFASDLVVFGTVTAIRPADRNVGSPDNPLTLVETAFDVDIAETFRVAGLPGERPKAVSVIIHHVGDRDRGDYIERYVSPSVNPLRVGESYLLFLRSRRGDSGWSLTGENGRSVMHVQGSVVAPQDSSPLALRTAGQPWSTLREELHRLGSKPGDSGQKEVRTQRLHIDGGFGELTSLAELVKLSDAVVVGRVIKSRLSHITPTEIRQDDELFLSTAYMVSLDTAVVWPAQLETPKSVEVEFLGIGDHDRGSHILRLSSEDYRPLSVGSRYVVFLRRHFLGPEGSRVVWIPATGDGQSIMEIRQDRLAPQAATRLAMSLSGVSPAALISEVSKLREKGVHQF